MVDFRRWITALAVLALFVGLAGAQVPGGGSANSALSCTATVAVPPALRVEGMTEVIGDILISCSGGGALVAGATIPTANITVSLGTSVTSRLLGIGGVANASEALLIIDEAGASVAKGGTLVPLVAGYGPDAPQTLCGTPSVGAGLGGCAEVAGTAGGLPVAVAAAGGQAANVFSGLVSGNQVTFEGIPILAPVSAGTQRTFRITNVRANVSGLGGGGLAGTQQLLASISISGSTSVPINNPVQIAGFVQAGLTTVLRNAQNSGNLSSSGAGFNQCNTASLGLSTGVAVLQFTENFGTAFKTRVQPTAGYNGQSGSPTQNVPGQIYNSESNFVFTGANGNGYVAGLADYGTRLKAVFNSIPAGVHIYVSVTNIATNTASPNTAAPAQTSTSSYAVLVSSEAAPDANGFVPVAAVTNSVNPVSGTNTTGLAEVPQSGGSGTAVWEVINTNPNLQETFQFTVFTSYSASVATNSPAPGTATVNLSYAPTPPVPFSTTTGAAASGSLTIPRFADTSQTKNLLAISICQTLLLFPFVTNESGFDTGIAIANTSQDPIGTATQAGTCTLNWYGDKVIPPTTVPSIAAGTVYTTLASTSAAGFQGYMFALCNFQFAHGFAFISDLGARQLAMGYLALVINNNSNSNNRNTTITTESAN